MAIGTIAGIAGWLCAAYLHVAWAFVVAWAVGVVLTGAVHIDGFLDACDGLFVSAPPHRRREILKDPHHGTFAVVGMALLTAFSLAALATIPATRYPLLLAFSAAAARLTAIPNAWIFAYAPSGGMMQTFAKRPSPVAFAATFVLVELLAWFIAPSALAIAPVVIAIALAGGWWSSRRLGGGLTGDVYGALIVVSEVLVLLSVSAMRR